MKKNKYKTEIKEIRGKKKSKRPQTQYLNSNTVNAKTLHTHVIHRLVIVNSKVRQGNS